MYRVLQNLLNAQCPSDTKSLHKAGLDASNKINSYSHENQKKRGHFCFAHSIL